VTRSKRWRPGWRRIASRRTRARVGALAAAALLGADGGQAGRELVAGALEVAEVEQARAAARRGGGRRRRGGGAVGIRQARDQRVREPGLERGDLGAELRPGGGGRRGGSWYCGCGRDADVEVGHRAGFYAHSASTAAHSASSTWIDGTPGTCTANTRRRRVRGVGPARSATDRTIHPLLGPSVCAPRPRAGRNNISAGR
jgi:hypothetical protein